MEGLAYTVLGYLLVLLSPCANGAARHGLGDLTIGGNKQNWGFVDVREGAHIFWWLYYTTNPNTERASDRPLAIWLQGGPGASSTGYGNFEEVGPLDLDLNPRNYSWVKDMNVLFIDSPVGSGFSYVDDAKYFATNNTQAGRDLVQLLHGFYQKNPEFRATPLHIFAESYGGKVAVEFAYLLNQEIQERRIDCNLKSVSSIDGWISPIDSMYSWAPFLLQMGFVDQDGHDAIFKATQDTEKAFKEGDYVEATQLWRKAEVIIISKTGGIDFYNVLRPQVSSRFNTQRRKDLNDVINSALAQYRSDRDSLLESLMRGKVNEALKIPKTVVWGSQRRDTFRTHNEEFMKPVIHIVEKLLMETSIEVNIITGQLDLIVATPGTVNWVNQIRWAGELEYAASERRIIGVNNVLEGYYKKHNKFALYWINRAGHMVPADNPAAMDWILQRVTKYTHY